MFFSLALWKPQGKRVLMSNLTRRNFGVSAVVAGFWVSPPVKSEIQTVRRKNLTPTLNVVRHQKRLVKAAKEEEIKLIYGSCEEGI